MHKDGSIRKFIKKMKKKGLDLNQNPYLIAELKESDRFKPKRKHGPRLITMMKLNQVLNLKKFDFVKHNLRQLHKVQKEYSKKKHQTKRESQSSKVSSSSSDKFMPEEETFEMGKVSPSKSPLNDLLPMTGAQIMKRRI